METPPCFIVFYKNELKKAGDLIIKDEKN